VGVVDKEKEILKSELCRENNSEENSLTEKESIPTHPEFHKSVAKLLEVISFIYKRNHEANKPEEFTVKAFKSILALYFGFHERNIGPRFNLLQGLGIIKVTPQSKMNRLGRVVFDLEALLNYCNDDAELFDIWLKKQKEESKWNMKN
jgi:hypothetical protein